MRLILLFFPVFFFPLFFLPQRSFSQAPERTVLNINRYKPVSSQRLTVAGFTMPDTVCVNTPVSITNTTTGASSYYWNFCVADLNQPPAGVNLGNTGGILSQPVFMDYVLYNNNYYGFLINHYPGKLVRLDFGNSLLNTPTTVDLGNFGGIIPPGYGAEGIQVVFNEGKWYAIIVGGYTPSGSTPRVLKIDFGANLLNLTPVATNWGNIGNLWHPVDLHVFQEGSNWYGLTVNAENNTITRFNFTSSFDNTPTAVNLGGFGLLNFPTGIFAINDNGFWRVFISNQRPDSRITRLDYGSSLLNTPTAVDLGTVGGVEGIRDLTIINMCDQAVGFAVNGATHKIHRLNFASLSSVPIITDLGNIGNLNFPHSIAKLFRVNDDLYTFITNVTNNTITRLRFTGCASSSPASSTLQNPPVVVYSAPGTYNINLTVDDGLPTQSSICKQIVVEGPPVVSILNSDTTIFNGDAFLVNSFSSSGNYNWTPVAGLSCTTCSHPFAGPVTNTQYVLTGENSCGQATDVLNVTVVDRPASLCGGDQLAIGTASYERAYDVAAVGNGYFTAGITRISGNDDILVTKFDFNNNIQWSKRFGGNNAESVRKIIATSDGGVLITGQTKSAGNANGDILCFKVSNGGALVWARKFGVGSSNGDVGMDIIETTDGGYAVSGILDMAGWVADAIVIKLDNALNVQWTKRFDRGDGEDGVGIVQKGDTLVVAIDLQNSVNHYESLLMKLRLSDGNFLVARKLTPAARGIFNPYLYHNPSQPGYVISGHTIDNASYANMKHTAIILDENFNVLQTKLVSVTPVTNEYFTGLAPLADGGFIGVASPQSSPDAYVYRINNDNSVAYAKRFNAASDRRFLRMVVSGQDVIAVGGTVNGGQEDQFVSRFPTSGVPANWCDVENASITIQQPAYTTSSFSWPTIISPSFSNTAVSFGLTDVGLTTTDICPSVDFDFAYSVNPCNPLAVNFNAIGNPITNPYWSFGDGNVNTGLSSPAHTYLSAGNYIVKFSVDGGCIDTIQKTITVGAVFDNVILTQDTTICFGATKQLLTAPALSFCWTPISYLDNPNSPQPVTSTPHSITYYYMAEVTGSNLIVNGSFSQGNTGFTSDYSFAGTNTTEGQYFVGPNPQAWNPSLSNCTDHTGGNGNMLLVNGSPTPNVTVWKQTVAVTPNTNYAFSTWIQALWPPNPAQLQFSINGKDIGPLITASIPVCNWTQFYTNWNSGNSSTAVISIVNKNTQVQGNDFALDDISFAPVFIRRDSVRITVDTAIVRANNDTLICRGAQVPLNSTGAQSYSWSPVTGLSDPAIANPVASPMASTQYVVTGTNSNGCVAKDTVNISLFPVPVITVSNDTSICRNTSVQLSASGGSSYSWTPSGTLSDPASSNPMASPVTNSTYHVAVTDANNCTYRDSVQVNILPPPSFSVNANSQVCEGGSVQLSASGGDIFSWQPAASLSNSSIANPLASPSATTTFSVTITESTCGESTTLTTLVSVLPGPVVRASKSNDIDCSFAQSQLTATGAIQYSWTPAGSLSNPGIANPVASPVTTTLYSVQGTDANGCLASDTVTVFVENVNKGGYLMPTAFTPNNDGLNDCYRIKFWGIIQELEFSIYNRWGERVFYTKDPGACWDGTYKGVLQETAVFVYMINAKTTCEENVFRKGTLLLIR